jgi:hypothetical protein
MYALLLYLHLLLGESPHPLPTLVMNVNGIPPGNQNMAGGSSCDGIAISGSIRQVFMVDVAACNYSVVSTPVLIDINVKSSTTGTMCKKSFKKTQINVDTLSNNSNN